MEWRRYKKYSTRGNGLNGMDIGAIKKQTTNDSVGARKFGTELTSNILNNQNKKFQINKRKRNFHQLNLEQKEEENGFVQPVKKFRYNLRSRTQSTEVLGNGKVKASKKPKKVQMQIDSDSDEDIDLAQIKKAKPVRRSLRLKNKRLKKLELEMRFKQSKIKTEPEYITDTPLLECDLENMKKMNGDLFSIDYVREITDWYYECEDTEEQRGLIKSGYISSAFQSDLNESMRHILLNWLVNVHRKFKLLERTLFLGVYIFDAYLSVVPVGREQLQLIGCASMWIASKYNEIYAPEANDFAYISDYSFTIQRLFKAEIEILCKLKFKFANIITPLNFTERFLQIALYPIHKKYEQRGTKKAMNDCKTYVNLLTELTYFFIELALFDCKLISTEKPSIISAAALCFAILSISLYSQWPQFLKKETKYLYKDLKPILIKLNALKQLSDKKKVTAVDKKHPSVKKWLDKLNINAVINNKDPN